MSAVHRSPRWRSWCLPSSRLLHVLQAPCVTEKTSLVSDTSRQFVFKVAPDASKREIRRAVELLFEVKVARVQVCNVKGKRKMFRRQEGRRPSWKKAYVRLRPGYEIDFMGAE